MNFYKRRNKKSNLSKYEIAAKLNTNLQKIEELENRELEIGGETFERYIDATNITKAEYQLEYAKMLEWYNETDLRQKRIEFGYNNQKSFGSKVDIPQSVLSNMETRTTTKPSFASLLKLYNFFNNDFNKNTNTINLVEKSQRESKSTRFEPIEKIKNINEDMLLILGLDWEKIISNSGKKQSQIADEMNVDKALISRIKHKVITNLTPSTINKMKTWLKENDFIETTNEDMNDVTKSDFDIDLDKQPSCIETKILEDAPRVNIDNTSKIITETFKNDYITNVDDFNTYIQNEEEPRMTVNEFFEYMSSHKEVIKLKEENKLLKEKITRYEKMLDKLLV